VTLDVKVTLTGDWSPTDEDMAFIQRLVDSLQSIDERLAYLERLIRIEPRED
jgi:hypothetical protein